MIKLLDLYGAVKNQLTKTYKYEVYGHEVIEDFQKPSFFISILPKKIENESIHLQDCGYSILITYHQKQVNQIDNLQKIDELKELFGYKLAVCDRFLTITDFDYDFVGNHLNILQFSFEIEYLDSNEKKETHQMMQEMKLNIEGKR